MGAVAMGSTKIYQKHVHVNEHLHGNLFCFFFISVWNKLFLWKLLKSNFLFSSSYENIAKGRYEYINTIFHHISDNFDHAYANWEKYSWLLTHEDVSTVFSGNLT